MVSWAVSGSSVVPSSSVPTWSAIVGMVGAALGIARDDEALQILAQDYAMAVQIIKRGDIQPDYHTIQSSPASRNREIRPRTRAQELGVVHPDDLNTTITRRDYVNGAHYRIFLVQMTDQPRCTAESIVNALNDPTYPLYAGRRSCVVGRVNAAIAPEEALQDATHWDQRIPLNKPYALVAERRDQLVGKRMFAVRHECIA